MIPDRHWPLVAALGALFCGLFVAVDVRLVVVPFVVGAFALIVSKPVARIAAVTLGGLFVLQSSAGIGPAKLLYLAVLILCWFLAVVHLQGDARPDWAEPFMPVLTASLVLLGLLAVSLPVALGNGSTPTDWFRDAFPYLLLALFAPIAVDTARDISPTAAIRLFTACGLIAAVGFALDWLDRRGVSALPLGKFTLSTFALMAAPFCYGLVRAALGPHRVRWAAFALLILVAVLVTGTRTGLVLLTAVLGVVGATSKMRVPVPRAAAVVLPLCVAIAVVTPVVALRVSDDPTFFRHRVQAAANILKGGETTDQSLLARKRSYRLATDQIRAHPVLGTGPGHLYETGDARVSRRGFGLDTPLVTIAKFGWVGSGIILALLVVLASAYVRAGRLSGPTASLTSARGFAVVFLFELPLGGFLEDKGLALGLLVLTTLVAAETRAAAGSHPEEATAQPQHQRRELALSALESPHT